MEHPPAHHHFHLQLSYSHFWVWLDTALTHKGINNEFIMMSIPCCNRNAYSMYSKALLANAATSALRLHQRLPRVAMTREFFGQLFMEDSAHYLLYSMMFLYSAPITCTILQHGVLMPRLITSSFHLQGFCCPYSSLPFSTSPAAPWKWLRYSIELEQFVGQEAWMSNNVLKVRKIGLIVALWDSLW